MPDRCPVCGQRAEFGRATIGDYKQVDCPSCGKFEITRTALAVLPNRLDEAGRTARARLSHSLRELQRHREWPRVDIYNLNALIENRLPPISEQLSNLIRWMLEQVEDDYLAPIETPRYENLAPILGAANGDAVFELVNHAVSEGLIKWVSDTCFALTVKGSKTMKEMLTESFTFVKNSGEVIKSGIKGRLVSGTLITFDVSLAIVPQDRFLRHLPSGQEEEFIVEDPGFQAGVGGIEDHFQVKVRRSDTPPASLGTIVNNIQGSNARVNIHSTDNSSNVVNQDQRVQVFSELRSKLDVIEDRPEVIEAIGESIDEMEAAHGTPSYKEKYQKFMAVAADHFGVFGPLLGVLSEFL